MLPKLYLNVTYHTDNIYFSFNGTKTFHMVRSIAIVKCLTNLCPFRNRQIWSRSRRAKNLTAGIWLIFRGLNFLRNKDIGQIGHFWMGTNLQRLRTAVTTTENRPGSMGRCQIEGIERFANYDSIKIPGSGRGPIARPLSSRYRQ
jgi:hypothetical protein